jgi:hypothetical protein
MLTMCVILSFRDRGRDEEAEGGEQRLARGCWGNIAARGNDILVDYVSTFHQLHIPFSLWFLHSLVKEA